MAQAYWLIEGCLETGSCIRTMYEFLSISSVAAAAAAAAT